jgi:hypothetical protein
MNVWTKRPAEAYAEAIEFAGRLPTGTTLSTGTLSAINRATGADATSTVLASASATISGTQAIIQGKAGTSPVDYLITLTATLSDGSTLVEEILLQVRLAMTLNVTPGDPAANSYCTRAEADFYHQTHLYNDVWLASEDWKKDAALVMATRLLDEQVDWQGAVTTYIQKLRWPRWGVASLDTGGWGLGGYAYWAAFFDPHSIPDFLKNATAEMARYLLTEDRTKERSIGMLSVKADTVQVNFDKHDIRPIIPPSVRSIVQRYGDTKGPGNVSVKLVRG